MTKANNLNEDGTLNIQKWAYQLHDTVTQERRLLALPGPGPVSMSGTTATAHPLVTNGDLGLDLIHLDAGEGFTPHTHPGDHLLIIVEGVGTITYAGSVYRTEAGQVYLVPGAEPHAVGAITKHSILAVGSPHKAADDPERMTLVPYLAVATQFESLTCLICHKRAGAPLRLHDTGCIHCPCGECTHMKPHHGG